MISVVEGEPSPPTWYTLFPVERVSGKPSPCDIMPHDTVETSFKSFGLEHWRCSRRFMFAVR